MRKHVGTAEGREHVVRAVGIGCASISGAYVILHTGGIDKYRNFVQLYKYVIEVEVESGVLYVLGPGRLKCKIKGHSTATKYGLWCMVYGYREKLPCNSQFDIAYGVMRNVGNIILGVGTGTDFERDKSR